MSVWKYDERAISVREQGPPEWFAPPDDSIGPRARGLSFEVGTHRAHISEFIDDAGAGSFALPPWQRGSVWTEAQRVRMLDSIMRNYTVGSLTLWLPERGDETPASSLAGCPVGERPRIVVDGQQRLTTLVMAARGDLDSWRWDGTQWTTGRGFMTPAMALNHWANYAVGSWVMDLGDDGATSRACADLDRAQRYELTTITLDGSLADMLDTYERLATCGTPHTVEELEIMRRWAADR